MTSKTHDIGALAAAMTVFRVWGINGLDWQTLATAGIATIVGAKLPDLDQATNRLWDLVPGGNFTGKIFRNLFLAHRTLSHSLSGIGLTYYLSQLLIFKIFNPEFVDPSIVFYALMIGYLSHIVLDGLTEEGVPLLFPLKLKFGFPPIKSWRIKTGRWFENWVVFPALGIGFLWMLVG